jgi:integrase
VRRELLTLWRYAFEEGFTEVPPLRVLRIRAAQRPVEAWSLDQLRQILECAEEDETPIGGLHSRRVCEWMPGWIVIAYDTGLRLGDLLALKRKNIRNGCINTTASKTGKSLTRPLSAYAQEWASRLAQDSPDGSLFSWFLTRRRALVSVRAFLDRHGFGGSTKFLRRSCATYVEASRPGEAWRYLQHSTPNLVPRHYADASLLAVPSGPPPIR